MTLKLDRAGRMEEAKHHWNGGRLDAAREVLSDAIANDSEAGDLWEMLGLVTYEQQEWNLAQSALERASVLMPLSVAGQVALGKCYDRSGHRQAAAAIYGYVATLPDVEPALLEPLAAGLGRAGKFELALEVCRRAARLMPENADPLIGIVHYMRRLRRPLELMLPMLYRAHQLEPANSEYRISLAWMLHQLGRSHEAAELLETVPFEQFSCIRCLTLMQQIFEHVGNEADAAVCRVRLELLASECPGRKDNN